jgi:hypothetical protein
VVEDEPTAVLLQDGEGRAAYVVRIGAKPGSEAAYERGLARAELAVEQHDGAGGKLRTKARTRGDGLRFRSALDDRHRAIRSGSSGLPS